MLKSLEEFASYVKTSLPKSAGVRSRLSGDDVVFYVEANHILEVLTFFRDDNRCQYKILIDVFCVDYPNKEKRFSVIYNLLSIKYNSRIRVEVEIEDGVSVPSCAKVFDTAGWFEREVWDMYGVCFSGHLDLRRILTDYGFDGYPQRKDFPLTGYVEVRYDEDEGRVVYEPVVLQQDYRSFDFLSPWEGTQYVMPQCDGE